MILFIIILAAGFTIIVLVEFLPILRAKQPQEIIVYSSLFVIAFVISLLQVINIEVPSPAKGLTYLIENVLHIAYNP